MKSIENSVSLNRFCRSISTRCPRAFERPRAILKTLQITAAEIHRAVKSTTLDRRLQQLWWRDRNAKEYRTRGGGRGSKYEGRVEGGCVFETRKESTGRKRADLIPSLSVSHTLSFVGSPNTRRRKHRATFRHTIQYNTRTCTRDVTRVWHVLRSRGYERERPLSRTYTYTRRHRTDTPIHTKARVRAGHTDA